MTLHRLILPLFLLTGCGATGIGGSQAVLRENQTAFAAEGLSVLVARGPRSADVTILSSATIDRETAAAIALKAAREATGCRIVSPAQIRLATAATAETQVRVDLGGCA